MSDRAFPLPDIRHASWDIGDLLTAYHRAKWDHDLDRWLGHFAEDGRYGDATLGWFRRNPAELRTQLEQLVPRWGAGRSWATRVVGGPTGAIVAVTDDPELFGAEIHSLSLVGVRAGRIVRFVDYWDSRSFGTTRADGLRAPEYPRELLEPDPRVTAEPAFEALCRTVQGALADGDARGVGRLLDPDVVWEDRALRLQLVGRRAVERYLERSGGGLPYTAGAEVLDVVGGPSGGGWTWLAPDAPVATGVVAVELTPAGTTLERITVMWDGGRLPDRQLGEMTAWAYEPAR